MAKEGEGGDMRNRMGIALTLACLLFFGFGMRELQCAEKRNADAAVLAARAVLLPVAASPAAQAAEEETSDPLLREIDWTYLRQLNPDIVAWLYVPGSAIDRPVLGKDSYLKRDVTGQASCAGSLFTYDDTDWTADSQVLIFGHNMSDGEMFGGLKNYKDAAYAAAHDSAYVYTRERTMACRLCGVQTGYRNDPLLGADREAAHRATAQEVNDRVQQCSLFALPKGGGQVFTLSACDGPAGTDRRLLVHFSVVRARMLLGEEGGKS